MLVQKRRRLSRPPAVALNSVASQTSSLPAKVPTADCKQRIEPVPPILRDRMRRGRKIDALPGQNLEPCRAVADPFQLRQMRVEVECRDAVEQAQRIQRPLCLDRRRRSVRGGGGPQPEAILHRHAEPGEQRQREPAKSLPRRDRPVTVMEMFGDPPSGTTVFRNVLGLADVVVRA